MLCQALEQVKIIRDAFPVFEAKRSERTTSLDPIDPKYPEVVSKLTPGSEGPYLAPMLQTQRPQSSYGLRFVVVAIGDLHTQRLRQGFPHFLQDSTLQFGERGGA